MIRRYGGMRWNSRTRIMLVLAMVLIMPTVLTVSPALAKPKARAQWTFMVYMAADNNLDPYSDLDIEEMKIGLRLRELQDVNVVVLWDKYGDSETNLYKITKDGPEIVPKFPLNYMEANMGDPDTLRTFVQYAMQHFRARHYALVLWNHGDDFRGCCWDEHPEGHLWHQDITQALSDVQLDILAFDACVEGMIEVVYEYVYEGLQISYVVATEGYVPMYGYPYDKIIANLVDDPAMTTKIIVDEYIAFFDEMRPAARLVELASIDMNYVDLAVQQLGILTDVLEELLSSKKDGHKYHNMIENARDAGTLGWSEYGWEAYIDLRTFVNNLETLNGGEIPEATSLNAILSLVIYYVRASEAMESAEGLGIFFPNSHGSFLHKGWWDPKDYLAMQFPYKGWLDFLQVYWGKELV